MLFILLLTAQPVLSALLQNPLVSGHLKTLDLSVRKVPASPIEGVFFSANNLRFNLKGKLATATEFEFALENLLLYSDHPEQISLPTDSPNRKTSLAQDWNRGQRWSNRLAIDRLSIKGSSEIFDWSVGRQAIGFGRIAIFSPLDIVAPFAPDSLDTDIRPGVDALRGVHYFGLGGQIGGTIIFGDGTHNNSYLLTFSDNRKGIDLLGIGGMLRERELIGVGLASNLGALGIKAEITRYNGKHSATPGGDLHNQFAIGAVEFWYRFNNGITLLSEYFYNGAGATRSANYLAAAASAAFAEGLSPLLGQHYLLLVPSWDVHPLVTVSGLVIRNLQDDSTLLRPQVKFSLADNLSLDLFYSFNLGKAPRNLLPGVFVPQSEFGSVGDSGGLLLRWYF